MLAVIQIRNGARHFQDTVVGAGTETHLGHGIFQMFPRVLSNLAMLPNQAGRHLGIRIDLVLLKALLLNLARLSYTATDFRGCFSRSLAGEVSILDGRNVDMDIDSVQQRPGYFRNITLDQCWRTRALPRGVIEKPAGTGVHGGRQHEAGRKSQRGSGAGNRHLTVFQRLSHHF